MEKIEQQRKIKMRNKQIRS